MATPASSVCTVSGTVSEGSIPPLPSVFREQTPANSANCNTADVNDCAAEQDGVECSQDGVRLPLLLICDIESTR